MGSPKCLDRAISRSSTTSCNLNLFFTILDRGDRFFMMAALFLLMMIAIGLAYSGNRNPGMIVFFVTLFGCCLMLYHLATTTLRINW